MIFQRFNWNFLEEGKDKIIVTVANRAYGSEIAFKTIRGRKNATVWKVEGGEVPGFIVAGGKPNFRDSWRR